MEQIIPDEEAYRTIEREFKDSKESDAQKYRLMQADTLLRVTNTETVEELNRMAEPAISRLIHGHNAKMRLLRKETSSH